MLLFLPLMFLCAVFCFVGKG